MANEGKRIFQYPEVTTLTDNDYALIDNRTGGPKSIKAKKLAPSLMSKTITERGTYKASDDGVRGYNEVDVEIPYTDVHVATGAIATFEGEDLPLKSLTASIVPVQSGSGDPSPSNVRPISGWTEEVITVSPLNISLLYNGQIYGNGDWGSSNQRVTNASNAQDNLYFLKAGTYTLDYDKLNSNAPNLLQCTALTKDDNYTPIDNFANSWNSLPFTFTLTQDGYLYFTVRKDAETFINPSDYRVKIVERTTTIPFTDGQGQSVTVYGGTLDVTSGVLTVDRVMVDLSTVSFYYNSNEKRWNRQFSDMKEYSNRSANLMFEQYKATTNASMGDTGTAFAHGKDIYIYDANQSLTINGKCVYELATPITYQLTPTAVKSLDGENNVFASTGDVDVEYQTVWVRPTE